jgi:hypothetical protein
MKIAWQWVMQNNQETNYPHYFLTDKFFSCKEEVQSYYSGAVAECLVTIIGPFERSEIHGYMAEHLLAKP